MIKIINTKNAPKAIGPYSQGIDLGKIIMLSGQIPIDPKTGLIDQDIKKQVIQSLNNIKEILFSINLTIRNIVKTTLFIIDFDDFHIINMIYENFFKQHSSFFPARSCIEVSKLPKNSKIEIEAIACRFNN